MGRCERNLKPVRILLLFGVEFQSRATGVRGFDGRLATQQQGLFAFEHRFLLFLEVFFHALERRSIWSRSESISSRSRRDGVAQRIDAAGRMRHGGIVEDAQHVRQGVHFAQRREDGGIARAVPRPCRRRRRSRRWRRSSFAGCRARPAGRGAARARARRRRAWPRARLFRPGARASEFGREWSCRPAGVR